jgi:hypothetical protein
MFLRYWKMRTPPQAKTFKEPILKRKGKEEMRKENR